MASEKGLELRNFKACAIHLKLMQKIKIDRDVVRIKEGGSAFEIMTNKPKGKRPLGRSRLRCGENIRMDLKEISCNTQK